MKIGVFGLWHLGSVTAICLADTGFDVIAVDDNKELIENFKKDILPVFEPGLQELSEKCRKNGKLKFSSSLEDLAAVDVIWVTFDTPVDDNDIADVVFVKNKVEKIFPYIKEDAVILISSQMPVGSTHQLRSSFHELYPDKKVHFAYSPENLRLGNAISVFKNPDRIIAGISSEYAKQQLKEIFQPITENVVWMSVASAEMTKHAINAFLATSVVFINELAVICERVGADASEVEKGLKTEQRIGPKAYVKPGSAFAGGTLARDLSYLIHQCKKIGVPADFFQSVINSNGHHRNWALHTIQHITDDLVGKKIAVLGLTYKPGTDTLRRSESIKLCKILADSGAIVSAFDPALTSLPEDLRTSIALFPSVQDVLKNAEFIVVATECPEFLEVDLSTIHLPKQCSVIDANGFLHNRFIGKNNIDYYRIGKKYEVKK